jgi:hypothetical protein
MWNPNRHSHASTAATPPAGRDLDLVIAQRDALLALAEATAELLSRWSLSAGDMLRKEAVRCMHAPEAQPGSQPEAALRRVA